MKIFVAVVSYDRKMDIGFCMSFVKLLTTLDKNNIEHYLYMHCCNCNISDARTKSVKDFLATDSTHLLFLDTDLMFDETKIINMINADKDIIAGAYPLKDADGFPVSLILKDGKPVKDGELYKVTKAPTGFMLIKRGVFEKLKDAHPEWIDKQGYFRIFESGRVIENDNEWYSEDISFCLRSVANGFEIFIYPDIDFKHIVVSSKDGNIKTFIDGITEWKN